MVYDVRHGLVYFAGVLYGKFFDSATNLRGDIRGVTGMSAAQTVGGMHGGPNYQAGTASWVQCSCPWWGATQIAT